NLQFTVASGRGIWSIIVVDGLYHAAWQSFMSQGADFSQMDLPDSDEFPYSYVIHRRRVELKSFALSTFTLNVRVACLSGVAAVEKMVDEGRLRVIKDPWEVVWNHWVQNPKALKWSDGRHLYFVRNGIVLLTGEEKTKMGFG